MLFLACRNSAHHLLQFIPLGGLQHRTDVVERFHSINVSSVDRQASTANILEAFEARNYIGLHYQDGSQQIVCFVFSHVVFLLLVDGVATATVAVGGVAFYLWGWV